MKVTLWHSGPIYRVKVLNWACFFVGMAVVWCATHDWVALLGAWVASLDFGMGIDQKGKT